MAPSSTGVLLVNLGTPEAPTPSAVRKYLREFLSDPRVVELPRLAWLPILYFLVLPFRPGKTAKKYAAIWRPDGSPLRIYHERQAQLLRGYLGEKLKSVVPVFAAMRYGKPSVAYGLEELAAKGCTRVLVIPMYPQYAGSAPGSVEDAVEKATRKANRRSRCAILKDFHAHRAYAEGDREERQRLLVQAWAAGQAPHELPRIPKKSVEAGDPYQQQCLESARLIATELGWNDQRTAITFQSRFGAAEWIKPYTADTLAGDGASGCGTRGRALSRLRRGLPRDARGDRDGVPGRFPERGWQGFPLHPYHERHPALDDSPQHHRHGTTRKLEEVMLALLARWAINAAALLLVAYLYPGVKIESFIAALMAALVLGLINAVVRPILVILTLPVTLLTLGLFLFVIKRPPLLAGGRDREGLLRRGVRRRPHRFRPLQPHYPAHLLDLVQRQEVLVEIPRFTPISTINRLIFRSFS
jgi:ferrochelatase